MKNNVCPIYQNPQIQCSHHCSNTSYTCINLFSRIYNNENKLSYFSCAKFRQGLAIKEIYDEISY